MSRDGAESDAEKSDTDLVVDVANEEGLSPGAAAGSGTNGDAIRENGDVKVKIERPASQSGSSSNRSTPSLKSKEVRSLGMIFLEEDFLSLLICANIVFIGCSLKNLAPLSRSRETALRVRRARDKSLQAIPRILLHGPIPAHIITFRLRHIPDHW